MANDITIDIDIVATGAKRIARLMLVVRMRELIGLYLETLPDDHGRPCFGSYQGAAKGALINGFGNKHTGAWPGFAEWLEQKLGVGDGEH